MHRALLAAWILFAAACGRVAFDPLGDGGAPSDGGDAPAGVFDPRGANCADAEAGPFVLVDSLAITDGAGFGVWARPPFVLAADQGGGLRSARFDGTAFTQIDHVDRWYAEALWSDGTHFFLGIPGYGLAVYDLGAEGQLILRAENTTELRQARRGWSGDGGIQFVPSGGDGLFAVRFDGSAIQLVGTQMASLSWAQGVWAIGSRVYFADADRLRVVDFDGSAFTEVAAPDASHGGSTRIWNGPSALFVANGDGVTAYRIAGTSLVELDTFDTADPARDVWSDGVHVFVAAEAAGVFALSFVNDQFVLVDQIDTGGGSLGVFGDGTFLYTNDFSGGLRAYRGFACRDVR